MRTGQFARLIRNCPAEELGSAMANAFLLERAVGCPRVLRACPPPTQRTSDLRNRFHREGPMKLFAMIIAISVIATSAAAVKSHAQTSTSPPTAVTGMKPDRTTADAATRKAMREKEMALRQKRADCRQQARQQKVPLLKRRAFVKGCLSRS